MTLPTIPELPDPPQRGQDPALFIQRADAFIDALAAFGPSLNAFAEALILAAEEAVLDPQSYVRTIDAQNVEGEKTFLQMILAEGGVRINDIDLTGLTAAGKTLIEAATVAAQRAALGLGTIATRNKATLAELLALAADSALTLDVLGTFFDPVNLVSGTTVALDWSAGYFFKLTAAHNPTFGNPSAVKPGTTRVLYIVGSDATARTIAYGGNYKGALDAITDITATKGYLITLFAVSATHIVPIRVRAL